MQVGIVGAGAMGSLFGGYLAGAGHEVWFVDVDPKRVEQIRRSGLLMTHAGERRHVQCHGTVDPRDAGPSDLVMFWCKSYATAEAVQFARPLIREGTIVATCQNGLGNVETILESIPIDQVVYGVTNLGAVLVEPGHIELTKGTWDGTLRTLVGGRSQVARHLAQQVAKTFRGAGMSTEVHDDIDVIVWSKLAIAAAMSPIASLMRMKIGVLVDSEDARELLRRVTSEVVAVANAKGIALDFEDAWRSSTDVYAASREHLTSMVQDVLLRRPTEVDALAGAVVKAGGELGVPTPVSEVLWRLVRTLERHYADVLMEGNGS
jgi:2-dehydropantoate 2-reductase